MIIIDGSEGEGGGQIVRNSCALSLVTGRPFRIINARGNRESSIGGATCEGVAVGASDFSCTAGRGTPGEYHFAVGTAGSTGLVLQTVLVPLLLAGGPSRLVLEGGTHNMLAPPFDFVAQAFAPVVRRMGAGIEMRLVRHGFYPRGGGRIEVEITPAPLSPIDCLSRGAATHRCRYPGEDGVRRHPATAGQSRRWRAVRTLARSTRPVARCGLSTPRGLVPGTPRCKRRCVPPRTGNRAALGHGR